ncbi:molybdopterin synthase sulfur carrier subunit [Robiginitalea myxolifaciens]|uniref:Molybdopterin synthase sulfur carrier subunit n=1 Tax=Robiginitalea myxolifaciens TaxID=400055 RepID=A0A1I6GY26_9FLAO|nr:MoaD/ThiS family protein [Robiginitalea myxolifaciens]SFR46999.1 molybdopterin synthase sulfur carrier subunit [Robiginitalea myxolifaciens]
MKVLLFGVTRDIVGLAALELESSASNAPGTVGELKGYLKREFPDLKGLSSLAIAVNQHYAEDAITIGPEDEIAVIPPVSGG